jgi:hypothetical protein
MEVKLLPFGSFDARCTPILDHAAVTPSNFIAEVPSSNVPWDTDCPD